MLILLPQGGISTNNSPISLLWRPEGPHLDDKPPILPPLPEMTLSESSLEKPAPQGTSNTEQLFLPPLQFEKSRADYELPEIPSFSETPAQRALTPITEGSDPRHSRSISADQLSSGPGPSMQQNVAGPSSRPSTSPNGNSPEQSQSQCTALQWTSPRGQVTYSRPQLSIHSPRRTHTALGPARPPRVVVLVLNRGCYRS